MPWLSEKIWDVVLVGWGFLGGGAGPGALSLSVQLSSALFPCSNRAALHLYSNTLNFQ